LGFKGSCHLTNYVIQAIVEIDIQIAIQLGIKSVEVKIKGLGYGKEYLLHGLQLKGLIIIKIQDVSQCHIMDVSPLNNIVLKYHHKVIHFQLFNNTVKFEDMGLISIFLMLM